VRQLVEVVAGDAPREVREGLDDAVADPLVQRRELARDVAGRRGRVEALPAVVRNAGL